MIDWIGSRFGWTGDGDCVASFACDGDENVCNDFGIKFEFPQSVMVEKSDQQVCSTKPVDLGVVPNGEHLVIKKKFKMTTNCTVLQ